jgi:hypothetical protein
MKDLIEKIVSKSEREYELLCFKYTNEGEYFIPDDDSLIEYPGWHLINDTHVDHIPITIESIEKIFTLDHLPDCQCNIILWSIKEGMIAYLYKHSTYIRFKFFDVTYSKYKGDGPFIFLSNDKRTFIRPEISVFGRDERVYAIDSLGIRVYSDNEEQRITYRRSNIKHPRDISCMVLITDTEIINIDYRTLGVLRNCLRRHYDKNPSRVRKAPFNPIMDFSYTSDYFDFTLERVSANMRLFKRIALKLVQ